MNNNSSERVVRLANLAYPPFLNESQRREWFRLHLAYGQVLQICMQAHPEERDELLDVAEHGYTREVRRLMQLNDEQEQKRT